MTSPIVHHPLSFSLGFLQFTGFGIAVLAAFVVSQIVAQRELARRGHMREAASVPDLILAAVVGTLLGAKLYYVVILGNWDAIFTRGGFVFWGGFVGAVLACYAVVRYKKLSFLRYSDVAGIAIAAGYAVGRTGCWAVGDDYGKPWNGPLAVSFPEGAPASTVANMTRDFGVHFPAGTDLNTVVSVIPTQLIEVALGLVMFAIAWRLRDHKHAEGWLFGVYCVMAGVERFLIEFLRAKDDRLFGPITGAQVISIGIVLFGVAWMAWRSQVQGQKLGIYALPQA
jgi:phosphatidylglycerol:prolipoprotein diacylglycerol transferase